MATVAATTTTGEVHVPATDDAIALARAAAHAADEVKATDIVLLDVADILALADVFVLATAASDRQLKAVAERIEERLRDQGRRPLRREGTPTAGWMLLDFGDVVCHLFHSEQRDVYALERLWGDVERVDPGLPTPLVSAPTGSDAS